MNWNNVRGCEVFWGRRCCDVCLCSDPFFFLLLLCCYHSVTDHKMNAALDSMIGSNRTKLDEMQRVIMKQRQQISDTRR